MVKTGNKKMKTTNEIRVLRDFVEEFSPIHQGQAKDFTYDELFSIVGDIVEAHYEDGQGAK